MYSGCPSSSSFRSLVPLSTSSTVKNSLHSIHSLASMSHQLYRSPGALSLTERTFAHRAHFRSPGALSLTELTFAHFRSPSGVEVRHPLPPAVIRPGERRRASNNPFAHRAHLCSPRPPLLTERTIAHRAESR